MGGKQPCDPASCSHAAVAADRVPASHPQPRRPELRPLSCPCQGMCALTHGGRPGPAPWELREDAWSWELGAGSWREGRGAWSGSGDRKGVVKDEAGPVNSGQAPPLPSQGQLLPVGAPPSWLAPRGLGKSEHREAEQMGTWRWGVGTPIAYALSAHISAPNLSLQGPQGSLFSSPSMPASTSVPEARRW